ncbi:hypothetical protein [Paenibacillus sp. WLX2291]|uniref:hypothetical protein n=1 Tax=Paenibacillus sp. WLX2291 TaxID=3296934 RepID=UPI0039843B48
MEKSPENTLYNRISRIRKADSEENLRFEMYAIVTAFILSKEIFKKNIDIQSFIENVQEPNSVEEKEKFKNYRPYIYDSRSVLLSRVLRKIEKGEKQFLYHFALDIRSHIEKQYDSIIYEKSKETRSNEGDKRASSINYTDSLFEKFKRKGNNE